MGRNNKAFMSESAKINFYTYQTYYDWLKLIALNIWKWENVPDTIDVRYLELTLFERGIAVYFDEGVLGHLALPVNLTGQYNVYGVPIDYRAYGQNGYQSPVLSDKNSVLIYNNYLRRNGEILAQLYAKKLTEIDRTMDVNITAQKTPVLVKSSEQQKLSMKNLIMQREENQPFLYVSDKFDDGSLTVLKIDAPYVADKLEVLKHSIINDYLSRLGVENSNEDKKERMVADEVQSNYGVVEVDRNIYLTPRQTAVEKINDMFGSEIEVSFNSDVRSLVNMGMSNYVAGGEEIG